MRTTTTQVLNMVQKISETVIYLKVDEELIIRLIYTRLKVLMTINNTVHTLLLIRI